MAQASLYLSQFILSAKTTGMFSSGRGQNLLDGGAHFYNVYRCKDDRYISVGCIEAKFYQDWVNLLQEAGVDATLCAQLRDEQLNVERWIEFKGSLQKVFLSRTRDDWAQIFEGSEACCSPVYDPEELKQVGNKYLGYPNRPFIISRNQTHPMGYEVAPQPVLSAA